MALMLALAVQAASPPPAAIDYRLPPAPRHGPGDCPVARRDEIVVCGLRGADENERHRIQPPASQPSEGLPPAAMALGKGVVVAAEAEAVNVGGFVSNRAMLRLKVRF
jgi:hypothetical protein